MNWTGGRLQRHSKASANVQLKTQKDYFARARFQQNTKVSALSPLNLWIAAPSEHQQRARHFCDRLGDRAVVEKARSQQNRRRSTLEHTAHKSDAINPHPESHRRATTHSTRPHTPPRVKTLEHVKQSLLEQSDWLGLAATRPPKLRHPSAAISVQIGRRRKVTREDRERQQYAVGQHKIGHNLIKPFATTNDASVAHPSDSANLSIRIGSNIHQSEASRPQIPPNHSAAALPDRSSTEPMLLDMVEARDCSRKTRPSEQCQPELTGANNSGIKYLNPQDGPDARNLVSLEYVRDFPSFDEVKRFSSFARHTNSSSRSLSKEPLSEAIESEPRPVHLMSGSHGRERSVHDEGHFSSNNKNHQLISIGSEPPAYAKCGEYISMQDVSADAAIQDTGSTSQEVRESQIRGTSRVSPRANQPDIGNTTHMDSSLGKVADAGRIYDAPAIQHGCILSEGQPRAMYTIEEQVQPEALRNQKDKRFHERVNSRNTTSNIPVTQSQQPDIQHERGPGSREGGPRTIYSTPEATGNIRQIEHAQSSHASSYSSSNRYRSQGDRNEEWMRDVFSTDFEKLQQRFSYAKRPDRGATYQTTPRNIISWKASTSKFDQSNPPDWRQSSSQYSSETGLARTINTSANTILNAPSEQAHGRQRNVFIPTETDFLEQMSPMTGYLDERIGNLSTYNNAANTVRDFVDQPFLATKRTASDAFGDNSYDQHASSSQSGDAAAQLSSTAPHRVPLYTLYQGPVRSPRTHGDQDIRGSSKNVPKPVWRHAEPPAMLSDNIHGRFEGQRQLQRRTQDRYSRFPLDYSAVKTSATYSYDDLRGGPSPQTVPNATLHSPLPASDHRVPLSSGLSIQAAGASQFSTQNLSRISEDRHLTPPVPRGASTSSHSAGRAPTSSSLANPTKNTMASLSNFHIKNLQPFAFKRPKKTIAQYTHPAKAVSQFRVPPAIPLCLH